MGVSVVCALCLIFTHTTQVTQVAEKVRVKLFVDDNTTDNERKPYAGRVRAIRRHRVNQRQHSSVQKQYVSSVKQRGVVEGVRGELWCTAPDSEGIYGALTWGSLTEAVFQALLEDPDNQQLTLVVTKGIEAKLLSNKTPDSVLKFLTRLHNRFHSGASTSFLELIQLVPEASRIPLASKRVGLVVS